MALYAVGQVGWVGAVAVGLVGVFAVGLVGRVLLRSWFLVLFA
jgi:hypothetical protein